MELIRFASRLIVRLVALHVAVYSVAIFGPVFFLVPFILITKNPMADYTWLALTLFWVTPISAGFYTNFYYHWTSVKQWRREGGKPGQWNQDNGGLFRTGLRSIAIMFGAMFASYVFELVFAIAFSRVSMPSAMAREIIGFGLMPFATFAPVILLWLCRWMRNVRQEMAH
jgi:ABC-type glycerol-3-phosphate transport system permease component